MRKTIYIYSGTAGNWRVERELEKRKIKKALSDAVCGVACLPLMYGILVLLSVY